MSLSQRKRHDSILQLLMASQRLSVSDLCDTLGASPSTVRRDLEYLDEQGLVIRTHGGAMLRQQGAYKPPYMERLQQHDLEKLAIARVAVEMISSRETIMISSGTTTFQLARVLAQTDREVTVITNAVDIAMEISRNKRIRTIVLGGEIGDSYGSGGEWALGMLQKLPRADKAFIGVDGIAVEQGITTYWPLDADTHRAMAMHAQRRIILADHSKFGVARFCHMFPVSEVSAIIADADLPDAVAAQYRKAGLNVILAPQ